MLGFPRSANPVSFPRRRPHPLYSERAMVAAAHPLAVEAGMYVFRSGGNAIDAAVGAGIAAAVVMPEMCGLGGDLFAVLADDGQPVSIQSSGKSARNTSLEQMRTIGDGHMPYTGPHAISVPGMVAAYLTLLDQFGTKSFAEVAEPAIQLARRGFALQSLGAAAIANQADLLRQDEAAKAVFLPDGQAPQAGDRLVQSDLADTLEEIGRSGSSFYKGQLAKRMTDYLQSIGGALTVEDFADFKTDVSAAIRTTYRDHTVYQTAIPSQGLILLESLNILEHADVADPQSAAAIHTMVEAKKRAYADRLAHAADLAFHRTPIQELLSKPRAAELFATITSEAKTDIPSTPLSDGDTTYICAMDEKGRMISLIQSVSAAFGAGIVAGDTGVVMNNRAGRGFSLEEGHVNIYAPGKKTMHTLNCFLVEDPLGRPVLVGGTPGGDGQPQWNMQMLVGMIDAGMDVQEAIEQPRWTSWPGTDPSTIDNPFELRIEDRIDNEVIAELESRGHVVKRQRAWSGGGAAQLIARDPDRQVMIGGSDPRVEGLALGY